jgi:hypothetical protein
VLAVTGRPDVAPPAAPATPPVALATSIPAIENSRYTASDLRFFKPLQPRANWSVPVPPETLDDAFHEATATVLAKVTGVQPGRTVGGDPALQFIEVDLEVAQVLRGQLRPELKGSVRVEFPGAFRPDPIAPAVDAMRANMPAKLGVWLLRWEGEESSARKPGAPRNSSTSDKNLYVVVHPDCGIFVETEDGVVSASGPSRPGAAAQSEAESYRTLGDLVARAKE